MHLRRSLSAVLTLAIATWGPTLATAQDSSTPKSEVFAGYSWYHPGGNVGTFKEPDISKGWGAQFTYNLNHWAGIAVDATGHYGDAADAHTLAVGPQFKFRTETVTPFVEAMIGVNHFAPAGLHTANSLMWISGGGLDLYAGRHLSIRPFQVDYVGTRMTKFAPTNNWNGVRLQAGLVFKLGVPPQEGPVSSSCSVDPTAVDAGTPVKVSSTGTGFLPKRTLTYDFNSTGGKVQKNDNGATIDTTGLAPGSYTVSCKVTDNGKGKHQQTASSQANFTVNEPPKHPPVLSCSANPTTVKSGDSATVTCQGSSPDNRPLTYNATATGGRLSGNGPTWTLDTAGAPAGTITVNANVADDRNLTASSTASVNVEVPPPPPTASNFGNITFLHDTKRPTRVDNEAKGELDRYADALAAAPDSKGVVVGFATAKESGSKKTANYAAQRAVNTKDYLTKEKGIDPSRIEVRTGTGDEQKVDLWVVPAGANFTAEGTTPVDESKVKAVSRTAPAPRHHRKAKKAQ